MEPLERLQRGDIVKAEVEEEQMGERGMQSADFLQDGRAAVEVYLDLFLRNFKCVSFLEASLSFNIRFSPSRVYSILAI